MMNKQTFHYHRPIKRQHHHLGWGIINLLGLILIPLGLLLLESHSTSDVILYVKQTKTSLPPLTQEVAPVAKAFLLADNQTGQIVYQKNRQERLQIASISKIIPAYLICRAIQSGKLNLEDPIKISPAVAKLSNEAGLSNVKLQINETYSVKDLLAATLLSSANAGVMALAQAVSPLPEFNQAEHEFLNQLGIKDFVIVNVNGLPNNMLGSLRNPQTSLNAENEMSATAVGMVATKLIRDFPQILSITEKLTDQFKAGTSQQQTLENTNKLVAGAQLALPQLQALGLKTGTNDYGYSFVGTFKNEGKLLTTVILNANSDNARFLNTRQLFQQFQKQYHLITLTPQTNSNLKEIHEMFSQQFNLKPKKIQSLKLWVPRSVKAADFHFNFNFDYNYFSQNKKPGLIVRLALNPNQIQFLNGRLPSLNLR